MVLSEKQFLLFETAGSTGTGGGDADSIRKLRRVGVARHDVGDNLVRRGGSEHLGTSSSSQSRRRLKQSSKAKT